MRAQTVAIRESTGRVLCCAIFREGGKKLLAKGHQLSEEDVRLLETAGMDRVWVTELEEDEVSEDEVAHSVTTRAVCGAVEIRLAVGGRANIFATENCCTLVDEDLLKQINYGGSVAIATSANLSYARAGQRIATVKSAPFAVRREALDVVLSILNERGPVLQARPIAAQPKVAVLYTDVVSGDRARQLYESVMRQRLERLDVIPSYVLSCIEEDHSVARSLHHLLRMSPTVLIVASTMAPAGPEDVVGRALTRLGCHLERYLAPVEPGNLFMLQYWNDIPIVLAPGCYRSAKPNILDLVLPPLLARYRLSGSEIASLGNGGLLS